MARQRVCGSYGWLFTDDPPFLFISLLLKEGVLSPDFRHNLIAIANATSLRARVVELFWQACQTGEY